MLQYLLEYLRGLTFPTVVSKIITACMHAYMYTCSYIILCGNIVLLWFCFTGATTSSIEQPTPTADSSSPGIYKYYDCVTTLIEQVTLPMRMPVLFFCSYYCQWDRHDCFCYSSVYKLASTWRYEHWIMSEIRCISGGLLFELLLSLLYYCVLCMDHVQM